MGLDAELPCIVTAIKVPLNVSKDCLIALRRENLLDSITTWSPTAVGQRPEFNLTA